MKPGRMLKICLTALSCILMAGCSSSNPVRGVARLTLDRMIEYEKQIDAKIAVEQSFYKEYDRIIREARGGDEYLSMDVVFAMGSQEYEKLLLHSEDGGGGDNFRRTLVNTLGKYKATVEQISLQAMELDKQLNNALLKIERDKKNAKIARNGLVELQKSPSDVQRIRRLYDFSAAVYQHMEEADSGDASQDKP